MRRTFLPHLGASSLAAMLSAVLLPAVASAVTYNVGPTRAYVSPCTLLTASTVTLNPGDVIVVDSGTYTESCTIDTISGTAASPITLQGAPGARPVMDGTGQDLSGDSGGPRAILQFSNSDNWVVEHMEFAHGTNADMNAAGIRVTENSTGVTLTDLFVHNNQLGVSSDTGASLTLSASEIGNNGITGNDGAGQNLFLAGAFASIVGNYIHDSQGGQNVRLRVQYGELLYNTIANAADYEMDMVMDGDSETAVANNVMIGNVVVRLATASNVEQTIVYGIGSPAVGTSSSLYAVFNTFILCDGRNRLIRALPPTPGATLMFYDNAVHGLPTAGFVLDGAALAYDDGTEAIFSGSNNWVTTGIATASPLTDTLTGANPDFTSDTVFTLLPASPLIDQGVAPPMYLNGMGAAQSGTPTLEIMSPLGAMPRVTLGPPDIGAFEALTRAIPMPDAGEESDATTDAGAVDAGTADVSVDATVDSGTDIGTTDAVVTDVATSQDGGVITDTGTVVTDVPAAHDAAVATGTSSSGCGCTVPGTSDTRAPWSLAGLLAATVFVRRRRR